MDKEEKNKCIYNDQFVSIYNDRVEIKTYYFPTGSKKIVEFTPKVHLATHEALGLGFTDYKPWGMALNNIFWAWSSQRFLWPWKAPSKPQIVLAIDNDSIRKGFSVEDPAKCLPILQKLVLEHGGRVDLSNKNE